MEDDWKLRYREYIDNRYLQLLSMPNDKKLSKVELLTLGAVKVQTENMELMVVTLPFHPRDTFVFKKEDDGGYYKW